MVLVGCYLANKNLRQIQKTGRVIFFFPSYDTRRALLLLLEAGSMERPANQGTGRAGLADSGDGDT